MNNIEKAFIQIYTCLVLALFVWNAINIVRFPYGADYGEAPLVDQAKRIQTKATLYKSDLNEPPYVITNYPPLYPALIAITNDLLKLPLFQVGRIISVFFSLISGVIIGLFTFRLTANKWYGVFSAALFWCHPFILNWSSLARVDSMALAFSLLGLWILFRYVDSRKGIALAMLCFLVSAFTRQTYLLAGPLAGFFWLWHINHKRALGFILIFGVLGLLISGMINAITNGGFLLNIVTANINRYDIINTFSWVKRLFISWPFILLVCATVVTMSIYQRFRTPQNDHHQLLQQPFVFYSLVFYTLGALITSLTIGKIGSSVNYFFELIAVCAIWGGLALYIINTQKKSYQWLFLGLFFIQLVWVLIYSFFGAKLTIGNLWSRLEIYNSLNSKVQASVQDGIVLSDDYMDLIVLSNQPVYYQPFEYGELYYAGIWNPAQFVQQINERQFPLIIIGGDSLNKGCCWSPEMISAMEANYQIMPENNVLILTPLRK